ncbi:unnamed protein product [Oppiella nova]|uniref:Sushi domain-containing protein n=1 Tax=Oppiella nova TaxID=334625 RepID=A0A7R9QK93_9ACAR|nr:unnamed protein product [Oppiella nova]CAG2167371.1 unnamed protein product [Oppiella nova]
MYLAISCEPPIAPQNGRLLDNTHYLAGDYVQYACNSGFVIMGEPLAICMDNGTWSSPSPICKAVCEFPGELANGHIEPTKFHYNIDETVTVMCNHNYRLLGTPKLKCNANGHWSSPKPHCRPFYF